MAKTHLNSIEFNALRGLRTLITDAPLDTPLRITITFESEKSYTTAFRLEKKTNEDGESMTVSLRNKCIYMTRKYALPDKKGTGKINTFIQSDSATSRCFAPQLKTDGERTTTDILQVLTTKVRHCFPDFKEATLIDTASIRSVEGITLSVFRVLRGGRALYEKYGYRSEKLNRLRDSITTITWKDIKGDRFSTMFDHVNNGPPVVADYFHEVLQMDPEEDATLLSVMNQIPMDVDGLHQVSDKMFALVALKGGFSLSDLRPVSGGIMTFSLDYASPEWQAWKNRLTITGVSAEPLPADAENVHMGGGKHQTYRKTRRVKR